MNVRLFPTTAAVLAASLCSAAQAQSLPGPLVLGIPSVALPTSALPSLGAVPALPTLPTLPVPSLADLPLPISMLPTLPQLPGLPALPTLPIGLEIGRPVVNLTSLGLPSPLEIADQVSPTALQLSDLTAVGPLPIPQF